MKWNMYSIFDTASGAYMRPFFMPADGQAVRAFTDIACDANHEVGKHPEDYSLVRCGVFDDNTCKVSPEDKEVLILGIEAVAQSRKIAPGELSLFADNVRSDN